MRCPECDCEHIRKSAHIRNNEHRRGKQNHLLWSVDASLSHPITGVQVEGNAHR